MAVAVGVGVSVATAVAVAVEVGVLVGVGATVAVGEGVVVGVGGVESCVCTSSLGGWVESSREARLVCVPLVLVRPRLNAPFPLTNEVTSTVVQVPDPTLPELPTTPLESGGALEYVIVVSSQVAVGTW